MVRKLYTGTLLPSGILTLAIIILSGSYSYANLPTYGKGGDDKAKPTVNPLLFPEKEWVIVEVIGEVQNKDLTPVVNIEKKNISQVSVTKIEVRNCKQNNLPDELTPLMEQIPGGRKVYKSQENGKTVYYISPVQETQKEEKTEVDPSSLSFPLFWNMKI